MFSIGISCCYYLLEVVLATEVAFTIISLWIEDILIFLLSVITLRLQHCSCPTHCTMPTAQEQGTSKEMASPALRHGYPQCDQHESHTLLENLPYLTL